MLADLPSPDSLTLVNRAIIYPPLTIMADALLEDAIAQINQAKSSYILCTEQQRPVGIFTERDLVRLVASGQSTTGLALATVMTQGLLTLAADNVTDAFAIFHLMKQKRVRHLPVVNAANHLVGIITQDSLLKVFEPNEINQVIDLLEQEVNQLRSEKQKLLEDRNRELENQIRLSQQLAQKQKSLRQANIDLENKFAASTADLRQIEHHWRTLLENVQLVVVGINADGKVTYANPFLLNLTGYTAAEIVGKDWFIHFVPPPEQPRLSQYFQQLLNQPDTPRQYQNTILTRSGETRIIVWNNTLLRNRDNVIMGSMSIGEDITERFSIDRMKSEFIAMVGHELRTPLASLHGGLKLLTKGLVLSDSAQGQQLLQVAAKSSQRLVELVNNILDLECLESGKIPLQKQHLNTRELTRQATDSMQSIAAQTDITLEVSDPGFELMADASRLNQVLTHLLDNAIKFSPVGSTIWLTVVDQPSPNEIAQETPAVLFTVRDQGPGIPPEQCTTIFDRFMQADSSDTRPKGGTGLGLAICRKIIEQHRGKIWVESTFGAGSCFYLMLPVS